MREGRKAEQLRLLGAECEDFADERLVVVRAVAARRPQPERLLAQIAARSIGEERLHVGARVGDHPFAFEALRLRRGGRAFALLRGEPCQIGFAVEHKELLFLVRQHVLAEFRVERREALIDGGEPRLVGVVQRRAMACEIAIDDPDEALLLRRQTGRLARLIDRLHAREERRVLHDFVGEGGEHRRHLHLDGLHLLVVQRGCEDAIDDADAMQRAAGILQRRDRVRESGRLRDCSRSPRSRRGSLRCRQAARV